MGVWKSSNYFCPGSQNMHSVFELEGSLVRLSGRSWLKTRHIQWISCQLWISMLLYDSWHCFPTGLWLNRKHLCVILSYYSVSSWQRSNVIVGKLIGFAGSVCSPAATVCLSGWWWHVTLYCSVSAAERKGPEAANIIQLVNLSPLHYTAITAAA